MPKKTREQAFKEEQAELESILKETREAFEGEYAEKLTRLQGLSDADLTAIVPEVTAHEVYAQLMAVVKRASAANWSAAQLKERVQALGTSAIAIAKKVGLV